MRPSGETFQLIVHDSSGGPLPALALTEAMVVDLESVPPFEHRAEVAEGAVRLPVPDAPFGVAVPLNVEGFGNVWIYADNGGAGYDPRDMAGGRLSFNLAAAESRVAKVLGLECECRASGAELPADYQEHMAEAQTLLEDSHKAVPDDTVCARLAMSSLTHSLHAGELLVVARARAAISGSPPRREFRFGCHGFRYPQLGEPYAKLFGDLLNFVTLPFYRSRTEPTEGARDFTAIEKILEWTTRDGLEVKGHPLVWFHRSGLPEWLRGRGKDEVAAAHRDYVLDAVTHFRDRVHIWDIINEAHDWANDLDYTQDELAEATRQAADALKEADPSATRIVNSCCTWSEYIATGKNYSRRIGRAARSPLQYVRDLIAKGVEFEAIGLQMYYPARDLLEIDRQLERFCALGKPVHITELGVSSSTAPVKHDPITDVHVERFWHGEPWSESIQADWVEAYYTLCYAKPSIEAVTWWDFSDPSFVPHGGFVDEQLRPKESYHRLQRLVRSWQKRS